MVLLYNNEKEKNESADGINILKMVTFERINKSSINGKNNNQTTWKLLIKLVKILIEQEEMIKDSSQKRLKKTWLC